MSNIDSATGNLLDFAYYKENYRLIAIDLSKQTIIKDLQQITVTGGDNHTTVAFQNCAPFNKCRTEINETFVDESKLNDINSLINNTKNKTISEVDAKKKLNALNKINKTEIKNECLINGPKKLLNLVDDLLEAIFNNNKNKNENNNVSVNEYDNVNVNEYDNISVNENDDDNISDNVNDNDNVDDNDSDNDNVDDYEIMKINNYFKTIDETKSFEDQTEELKKEEYLDECWYMCYYDNNKETNFKIFKLKCAYLLIDIDENLFKEIFGSTFVALADKLINTTSKEQYQIIISNIKKIKIKFTNKMILIIL